MTSDEFRAAAIALLKSSIGWQSAIAQRLNIDSRAVRRWLKEGVTPAWVDERLLELMGARELSPWPRDEWVIGDALTGDGRPREYIMHIAPPRFVARIVEVDESGHPAKGEQPADVIAGTVYNVDDSTLLCEIDWIEQPPAGQITQLLDAAADAIHEMGDRAAREMNSD